MQGIAGLIVHNLHPRYIKMVAAEVGVQVGINLPGGYGRRTAKRDVDWKKGHNRVTVHPLSGSEKYMLLGGGRAARNACVHGYAALIEALLRQYPAISIETPMATYDTLSFFHEHQSEIIERIRKTKYGKQECTCETRGPEVVSTLANPRTHVASGG